MQELVLLCNYTLWLFDYEWKLVSNQTRALSCKSQNQKSFLFSVEILRFQEIRLYKNILAKFLEKQKNILQNSWKNGQENFDGENRKKFCL